MAGKRVWKAENYYEEALKTRGEEALILFSSIGAARERDAFSVPHSVQKSIPIKRIYQDGVFQVSGKFSKTWRFFCQLCRGLPEKQRELFMTYCSFLNSLPIGATAKITLFNRQLNQKDFGRTLLMPMQGGPP